MSHCGKSHWNGVKSSLFTNSSILENASADFAQNFTDKRQNPTNCYYEIIFHFHVLISENNPNKMDAFYWVML